MIYEPDPPVGHTSDAAEYPSGATAERAPGAGAEHAADALADGLEPARQPLDDRERPLAGREREHDDWEQPLDGRQRASSDTVTVSRAEFERLADEVAAMKRLFAAGSAPDVANGVPQTTQPNPSQPDLAPEDAPRPPAPEARTPPAPQPLAPQGAPQPPAQWSRRSLLLGGAAAAVGSAAAVVGATAAAASPRVPSATAAGATATAAGATSTAAGDMQYPAGAFVPITPARVHDSRYNAGRWKPVPYPGPPAPMAVPLINGISRGVSVANSYVRGTMTVDIANVVPVGAIAVAVNLTITRPTDPGYVVIAPAGPNDPATSSINWGAAGVTIANGLIVGIDAERRVQVLLRSSAPTALCDFIIDVNGYFLGAPPVG